MISLFPDDRTGYVTLELSALCLEPFSRHAQDDRHEHTPTTQGKVKGSTCHPPARPPSANRDAFEHFLLGQGTGKEELGARENWFGFKGTTPVAKATARRAGQQRAQSWIPYFGPASMSGTMACGLVL